MNLLSKIQGSLLGVMIGDALGMPWEIYKSDKILELTQGLGVTGFSSPIFRKLAETENLTVGSTTDDWQLTEAIATSLSRQKEFDLLDIALAHVEAYETSTSGWGGTTRKGLEELKLYFDSRGKLGRSPWKPATGLNGQGLGNGIGMKISSVSCFLAVKLKQGKGILDEPSAKIAYSSAELRNYTVLLGKLTHPDLRATVAGYALASMLLDVLVFNMFNANNQAEQLSLTSEATWLLNRTINLCQRLESELNLTDTDSFSNRLSKLLDLNLLFGPIEQLISTIGTNCLALESICFAMAIFLRHPRDFQAGLLGAVNAGGDTDTIAAMAGSLIGAVVGVEGIPEEWVNFNSNFAKALTIGAELYQAALT